MQSSCHSGGVSPLTTFMLHADIRSIRVIEETRSFLLDFKSSTMAHLSFFCFFSYFLVGAEHVGALRGTPHRRTT